MRLRDINIAYITRLAFNAIEQQKIKKDVEKFLNTLQEYKGYMEYEFILNDIKNHYLQKENHKKKYDEHKKHCCDYHSDDKRERERRASLGADGTVSVASASAHIGKGRYDTLFGGRTMV